MLINTLYMSAIVIIAGGYAIFSQKVFGKVYKGPIISAGISLAIMAIIIILQTVLPIMYPNVK